LHQKEFAAIKKIRKKTHQLKRGNGKRRLPHLDGAPKEGRQAAWGRKGGGRTPGEGDSGKATRDSFQARGGEGKTNQSASIHVHRVDCPLSHFKSTRPRKTARRLRNEKSDAVRLLQARVLKKKQAEGGEEDGEEMGW